MQGFPFISTSNISLDDNHFINIVKLKNMDKETL